MTVLSDLPSLSAITYSGHLFLLHLARICKHVASIRSYSYECSCERKVVDVSMLTDKIASVGSFVVLSFIRALLFVCSFVRTVFGLGSVCWQLSGMDVCCVHVCL